MNGFKSLLGFAALLLGPLAAAEYLTDLAIEKWSQPEAKNAKNNTLPPTFTKTARYE